MNEAWRYPAVNMVFWPGKEVMACEEHTKGLLAINRAMGGAPLSVRPLSMLGQSGECSNCINEAKNDE